MHEAAVILGLIVINALFASAELALVSARRPRLKALAEEGHRGARAAIALLDDPTRLLSTVQVGITLVGILTGVYSGAAYSVELAAWISTACGQADWKMRTGCASPRPWGALTMRLFLLTKAPA